MNEEAMAAEPQSGGKPPALPPRWERTETQFDDWAAAVTERADPFMAWLGLLFALLVGYDIAVELSGPASTALEIAGWAIWSAFALEFGAKLWLAPRRLPYLRRHWWQAILLLVPFLRVLSFLRLARAGRALPASRVVSSSYRAAGTARYLLRSRLGYLGALSSLSALAIAELAYVFERDADGSRVPHVRRCPAVGRRDSRRTPGRPGSRQRRRAHRDDPRVRRRADPGRLAGRGDRILPGGRAPRARECRGAR